MVVSDTVWVTLITTFGTVITSLLAFIIAVQSGNRTRLDNINTQVNGRAAKAAADLNAAHSTIKSLRGQMLEEGIIESTPDHPGPGHEEPTVVK